MSVDTLIQLILLMAGGEVGGTDILINYLVFFIIIGVIVFIVKWQKSKKSASPLDNKEEKYCPECGSKIKGRAEICPECGARQPEFK